MDKLVKLNIKGNIIKITPDIELMLENLKLITWKLNEIKKYSSHMYDIHSISNKYIYLDDEIETIVNVISYIETDLLNKKSM